MLTVRVGYHRGDEKVSREELWAEYCTVSCKAAMLVCASALDATRKLVNIEYKVMRELYTEYTSELSQGRLRENIQESVSHFLIPNVFFVRLEANLKLCRMKFSFTDTWQ